MPRTAAIAIARLGAVERAASFVTELLRLAPNPANRMIAQGVADTRPLASDATPEERAQNRRVEVQIVGEDGTTTIELR